MRQRFLILFIILINSAYVLCQQNDRELLTRVVYLEDSVCSLTILTKNDISDLSKSFGMSIEDSLKSFSAQIFESRKRIVYSIKINTKLVILESIVPLFDLDKYFYWFGLMSVKEKVDKTFEAEFWSEELNDMPIKVYTHPKFR